MRRAQPPSGQRRRQLTTIPIVMGTTSDPVGGGFVKSLAHPGGNITGLSNMGGDVGPKLLELLMAVVPKVSRVGVLVSPTSTTYSSNSGPVQAAARKLWNQHAGGGGQDSPADRGRVFDDVARERRRSYRHLFRCSLGVQGPQIADLANKYRLPSVFGNGLSVEAGGLMGYTGSRSANFPARCDLCGQDLSRVRSRVILRWSNPIH